MSEIVAPLGMTGTLETQVTRAPKPHKVKSIRIPGFGRVMFSRDPGVGEIFASEQFHTDLHATHRDGDGKIIHEHDLGSGTVTNVGVLSLANDWNWAAPSGAAINTLKLQNFHATGTGITASAATDIALQTLASPTATTAVTGSQSLVSAANSQTYRTSATINYTTTLAVTEWGLHNAATLSATTGSPFTAGSGTTGTVTGTPLTASTATIQGEQQFVFKDTTAGTPFWGMCTSNSTGVVTVPAWYVVTNGNLSGLNPVNADAYVILPVLFDHLVFAAINVNNGDSITFNFSLLISSGG